MTSGSNIHPARPSPEGVVSIEDVAREAGVSIASVSRVVNGLPHISPRMRSKVEAAVNRLGYQPNCYSRSLRSGRSKAIAICRTAYAVNDDLYGETMIQHLTRYISLENYRVVLEYLTSASVDGAPMNSVAGSNRQVDGLCVVGHLMPEELATVESWQLPVCLINLRHDHPNFCSVNLQDDTGSFEAVQYLVAMGRRNIAFVYGSLLWPGTRRRYEGFLSACRKFGLEIPAARLIQVSDREQNYTGGFRATQALLAQPQRPDAIFYVNDWYATGGLAALYQAGIRVPEEICLVGYDNSWLAEQTTPQLTSVSLEPEETCETAVSLLLRKIENRNIARPHMEIRARLVLRETTPHF